MILIGCEKMADNKAEKIVGTWQVVPMDISETPQWLFYSDNKLKLISPNDTNIIEGTYDVELKQGRYYLNIQDIGYQNGKYLILKQNKEILILQRVQAETQGAFLRREFVKI